MDISVKEDVKLKKKFSAENMLEIWDSKKKPNSRKIEIGEGGSSGQNTENTFNKSHRRQFP